MMKYLLVFSLALNACSQSATLEWQYSSNELALADSNHWDYGFQIYGTNQLGSSFTNWQTVVRQPYTNYPVIAFDGTNYTFAYTSPIAPGQFFYTATTYNFWSNSGPSNTSSVPPLPITLHTTIQKNQ